MPATMSAVSQIKDAWVLKALTPLKLKARIKDLINTHFANNFSADWERGNVVGIEKNEKSTSLIMAHLWDVH